MAQEFLLKTAIMLAVHTTIEIQWDLETVLAQKCFAKILMMIKFNKPLKVFQDKYVD